MVYSHLFNIKITLSIPYKIRILDTCKLYEEIPNSLCNADIKINLQSGDPRLFIFRNSIKYKNLIIDDYILCYFNQLNHPTLFTKSLFIRFDTERERLKWKLQN